MASSTIALPQYKRKQRAPVPESRGWKMFWALPAVTALLLLVHGGRVVEFVYLPLALVLGLYLCLKFPRVYVAYALLLGTISPLANRIAASQSVFLRQSPLLAAPFLVVAMGALRMWKARPPGALALVFGLPLLGVLYGAGVAFFTVGPKNLLIPLAGWLSPIFFGLYCCANEDGRGSLEKMYVRAMTWSAVFIAVYGLIQYVSPFQWDMDWLSQMQADGAALSMGAPEPYGIRIFSSVSSPAFASVSLAAGIVLLSQLRSRWRYPAMVCALLTLIFTSVRAAWLALLLAGIILFLRASVAARLQTVVAVVVMVLVALMAGQTPQGSGVLARFSTLGNLKQDHSLRDRQLDVHAAWAMVLDKPFGGGLGYTGIGKDVHFSSADVGAVAIPIELGYFGALLYAAGLLVSMVKVQFPALRGSGFQLGLAVVSLLPIFLLVDEDLLASFSGMLFFAPTALLMMTRQRMERDAKESRRVTAASHEKSIAGAVSSAAD